MIKAFIAVILSSFLIAPDFSFAQETVMGSKIYSGYLHHFNDQSKQSLLQALLGKKFSKEIVVHGMQCSIEFKSPIPFSQRSVAVVPDSLTYAVKFDNDSSADNIPQEKDAFGKYTINIYTNDDEVYTINPDLGSHIVDTYIIYLILGSDINRLEIVSGSEDNHDKYVLDKSQILGIQ